MKSMDDKVTMPTRYIVILRNIQFHSERSLSSQISIDTPVASDDARNCNCAAGEAVRAVDTVAGRENNIYAGVPVYWKELDGLRTIAFLMVFLHHAPALPASLNSTWLSFIAAGIARWGWAGVDLFFVLSGFLITSLLLQEKQKFGSISLKLFYARRAIRIWPAYYLVLLILCIAIPLAQGLGSHPEYQRFLTAQALPLAFFLGNVSLTFSLDSLLEVGKLTAFPITHAVMPLWSLAVEEQFYLTWPLIVLLVKTPKNIMRWACALLVLSVASRAVLWSDSRTTFLSLLPAPHTAYYHCTLAHLDGLMIGAIIAIAALHYPHAFSRLSRMSSMLLIAALAMIAMVMLTAPPLMLNSAFNVPLFTIISAAFGMLVVAAFSSRWWKALLSMPLLAGPGKVTYTMYLIHYAVIAGVGLLLSGTSYEPNANWCLHVFGALLATYIVALGSWWLIESRCLSLRKHLRRTI